MESNNRSVYERLVGVVWEDRVEADIYRKVVELCLDEPEISRRLGKRPGANAEAVRSAMAAESNATRAMEPSEETLQEFRHRLSGLRRVEAAQADRGQEMVWSWRTGIPVVLAALFPLLWWQDRPVAAVYTVAALILLSTLYALSHPQSRRTLVRALGYAAVTPVQALISLRTRLAGNAWETDLRANGVQPLMKRVLDALLGDDPDELLLPDNFDGFRTTSSRQYVVGSAGAEQLARKMEQMDGGTIAVCGPRGSGKTTLLEHCVTENDFSVFASAPATFTPHEFLISLFSALCERYIESEGHRVPDFTRITTTHRAMRRTIPGVKRFATWISYALPALALIGLGTFAAIRSLEQQHGKFLTSQSRGLLDDAVRLVRAVWAGENIGAGMALVLAGVLIWKSRKKRSFLRALRNAWDAGAFLLGVTLVLVPVVSLFRDPELKHNWNRFMDDNVASISVLVCFLVYWIAEPGTSRGVWSVGRWEVPRNPVLRTVRLLCLAGGAYACHHFSTLRAVITDGDNQVRVLSALAGVALYKFGEWRPRPSEPQLVRRCRNQLYRLQTVQSTTSTLNLGTSQLVSVGSSHATAVTSVPPNLPELVADFRELLAEIALSRSLRSKRTIIAIDELDRLGGDAQALAFLSEIKAIFGVAHVHYLVSVAEDVGAAFVRRGLPYRDATDSSLDDVVHVQPGTLEQSERILQKRAPGISPPYMTLVHALSGGIPRDLIRYGRRVMETENKTGAVELSDISRKLILEELYETLSGFRVLLSRQEWTEEASPVLESFRRLMAHLKSGTTDPHVIHRHLSDFAEGRREFDFFGGGLQLEAATSRLLLEASSYAYFSLTLLDIFGAEGFTRRSEDASLRPQGDPQLLADARQELAVSPYTARSLLRSIRRAWGLPVQRTAGPARGRSRRPRQIPGQHTR
ncbi:hypothetical protein [Streptomyces naphthomycinicus]|uniref:hypothetical protein n=1 Tax=Streptomyces naphthomycinicus TaxID=2872625 RepID=UPI001CED76DC|nr:hypothetical protein [Streptomyces sp. TML10]